MEVATTPTPRYETTFGFAAIIGVLALAVLSIIFKYAVRREKYSKQIPSVKLSLFDIWGNISSVISKTNDPKFPVNVYILRAIYGHYQLFKKEKFFCMWFSYTPLLIVTKAEVIEDLLAGSKNNEKNWVYDFIQPWLGTGLLTSHGSKWKSRRKLLMPAFHSDVLRDFVPAFNEQSQLLVKNLRKETKKPWTNIITPIILCSLDIVCETILGFPIKAQETGETEYVRAVHRAEESIINRIVKPLEWMDWYYFYVSKRGRQQKKDIKLIHDFTRSIIAKKKKALLSEKEANGHAGGVMNGHSGNVVNRKRKALIDVLLEHSIENKQFSDEDIREEIDTFTLEGHDTTSMGMTWALYLIGLNKEVQEKMHEELDRIFGDDLERPVTADDLRDFEYMERVLKECLRVYPSVPFIGRKIDEDVTLCGTKIPKGMDCVVSTYCLHRDESVFPDPEKFDPDRFLPENCANRHPCAFIPFSAGPRNCIGQRFALMKEKVVIANILRNFTVESLDPRDKVLPAPELILRPEGPVRIKIRPRKS